jgi:hypothetical protein
VTRYRRQKLLALSPEGAVEALIRSAQAAVAPAPLSLATKLDEITEEQLTEVMIAVRQATGALVSNEDAASQGTVGGLLSLSEGIMRTHSESQPEQLTAGDTREVNVEQNRFLREYRRVVAAAADVITGPHEEMRATTKMVACYGGCEEWMQRTAGSEWLSPAAPLLIYRLSVDESRGLQDLGMLGRCKIDDAIYFPFSKHRDRGYLPPVSWSKEDKVSLRTFLTTQGLWLKSDDDAEI